MYTPVQPENLTKSYHGRSAPATDDASSRNDANQAAAVIKPLRSSTSAPLNLTVAAQIASGTNRCGGSADRGGETENVA
jgi:hypothetical protein